MVASRNSALEGGDSGSGQVGQLLRIADPLDDPEYRTDRFGGPVGQPGNVFRLVPLSEVGESHQLIRVVVVSLPLSRSACHLPASRSASLRLGGHNRLCTSATLEPAVFPLYAISSVL